MLLDIVSVEVAQPGLFPIELTIPGRAENRLATAFRPNGPQLSLSGKLLSTEKAQKSRDCRDNRAVGPIQDPGNCTFDAICTSAEKGAWGLWFFANLSPWKDRASG